MGGEEEEEITADDGFDVTPSTIANIRTMAKDRDPSLAFLPQEQFVDLVSFHRLLQLKVVEHN